MNSRNGDIQEDFGVKIIGISATIGLAGFFCDDQAAIAKDATKDGFIYRTPPTTKGFTSTRMAGRGLSILLFGGDGSIGVGDLLTVQYGGVANREEPYSYQDLVKVKAFVEGPLSEYLVGLSISSFVDLSRTIGKLHTTKDLRARELPILVDPVSNDLDERSTDSPSHLAEANGFRLPIALRFALTSAVLDLLANSRRELMADIVAQQYQIKADFAPVAIFAQSGDDRYTNVDKMILKAADALPHGLINNVPSLVGADGSIFATYLSFVVSRIEKLRPHSDYRPTLHFDVYGTFGEAFNGDLERVSDYMASLKDIAKGYRLRFEHPIDGGSFKGQIEDMALLKELLVKKGAEVEIVADEWCNDISDIRAFADAKAADMIHIKSPDLGGLDEIAEATLAVKESGLAAYLGGTCNESEISARATTHLAVALGADQVLAKPGMGVDEGLMLVRNEMERVLAISTFRKGRR